MNPIRGLRSLLRKGKIDAEMDAEMRAHIEMQSERNIARGMPPDEARYAAMRQFGNVASIQEQSREERGWLWLEEILKDIRFAARLLRKSPGFAVIALTTIALCLAANAVLFTLVRAIVLRPFPYPDADRVVNVGMVWPKWPWGGMVQEISPLTYQEIRDQARSFSAFGFIDAQSKADLRRGDRTQRLDIARVTPGVWSVTGVPATLGRTFSAADLNGDDPRLVVLSHELWRDAFNHSDDVLGQQLQIDDNSYQVVGVMPAGFSIASNRTQLWVPKLFSDEERSENGRGNCAYQAIGRLRDGVSIVQARDELQSLYAGYLTAHPDAREFTESTGQTYGVASVSTWVNERASGVMFISLQTAAGLVLGLGCLNIAGLLIVRGHRRVREIALRSALGASRLRIARQLAMETVVLFLGGGTLGLLLTAAALRVVPAHFHLADIVPYGQPITFDGGVVAATLGVSLLAGLLTGTLPILFATRRNPGSLLQALSQHLTENRGRLWTQSAFVVAQIALSLVLLTAAGVTVRNLANLLNKGFGVSTDHRFVASVALPAYRYGSDFPSTVAKINPFKEQALNRIRALPGVVNAAVSNRVPLSADWPSKAGFTVPGYEPAPGESPAYSFLYQTGPGYFATLGMPILRGRDLAETDDASASPVAVISAAIADRYFPDRDPIGARISSIYGRECEIVGVVGETQNVPLSLGNAPAIYFSAPQWPAFNDEAVFTVQAALPPEAMARAVTQALLSVDPLLSVRVTDLDRLQRSAVVTQSTPMEIAGFFAMVAVLLTALGLYGVLASSVAQRTKELAIRVALGAPSRSILRMVLGSGGKLALLGTALGALIAWPSLQWIEPLLATPNATRPDTIIYAAVIIIAVTLVASYLPARRASRVDPITALRSD